MSNRDNYLEQAIHFYNAKNFSATISFCNKAIKEDPRCARAFYGKGLAFFAMKRLDDARDCYNQAIELDSSNAKLYISRGDLSYEEGSPERAIKDYDKAVWLGAEANERWIKIDKANESIDKMISEARSKKFKCEKAINDFVSRYFPDFSLPDYVKSPRAQDFVFYLRELVNEYGEDIPERVLEDLGRGQSLADLDRYVDDPDPWHEQMDRYYED